MQRSVLSSSSFGGRGQVFSAPTRLAVVRRIMAATPAEQAKLDPDDPRHPAQKLTWRQRLGQSFNLPAIGHFGGVLMAGGSQALPHIGVPSIAALNWGALKKAGFKGCVFDKDNTLTEPYAHVVAPELSASLEECKKQFDGKVVVYSNSAGLTEFDPEGKEAEMLGGTMGIHVLRHQSKKPDGGIDELETHFGCKAEQLIMVGDRYLIDTVFGNKHGMLTIHPDPITSHGEPKAVCAARKFEDTMVWRWRKQGKRAPQHPLATPEVLEAAVIAGE
ncbi:hypothetical protein WJX73_010090 [Symbiochloris irregularis]|uniref:Mitochondrial PGP phosphatase n=1 Tax=Symbiochloris irregularis TaxID=706552 RepID=A0AAW1P480_9CHLO